MVTLLASFILRHIGLLCKLKLPRYIRDQVVKLMFFMGFKWICCSDTTLFTD